MLRSACKEWSVVCQALADGRQTLLLRKGGIQEATDGFRVEHERFWLFPTYVHQQEAGIVPDAKDFLINVLRTRPDPVMVRIQHFVEVQEAYHVRDLDRALALAGYHVLAAETVRQRFLYRQPGLFVLLVRVFEVPTTFEIPMIPYYEGCRSWVELEQPLSTANAKQVMDDASFARCAEALSAALRTVSP